MKVRNWVGIIVVVLAAAAFGMLSYLGMFSTVIVKEQKIGPYAYAYEEFTGPYQKTVPVFARVNSKLDAQGIKHREGIGVYFDNPDMVSSDKLRSYCGSIVEDIDVQKVLSLTEQKLKVGTFPQADCMVVDFPTKSVVSYMIAPMKVYPVLMKYMSGKGYKARETYEIYDMPNKKTLYVIPITK